MTLPAHTQVILGPPGTGKTSTLLGLIEDELEKETDPTRIGFFTFTKKSCKRRQTTCDGTVRLIAERLTFLSHTSFTSV